MDEQTLSLEAIQWVEYGDLSPNTYNPNIMTEADRELLKQSILEDGWTQPIVALADLVIVDGEQRWRTSQMEISAREVRLIVDKMRARSEQGYEQSESVLARLESALAVIEDLEADGRRARLVDLTGGRVPVHVLPLSDDAHKMLSTIRHNRARGEHDPMQMGRLTSRLLSMGLDLGDLQGRLGFSMDEARRLMALTTVERHGNLFQSTAAVRQQLALDDEEDEGGEALLEEELARQEAYQTRQRQFEELEARRQELVRKATQQRIDELSNPEALTIEERQQIWKEENAKQPSDATQTAHALLQDFRRIQFSLTKGQMDRIREAERRAGELPVETFLLLFRSKARQLGIEVA